MIVFRPKGCVTLMDSKKKAILDRIKHLEDAIAKGREYLESGEHAHWHGFRHYAEFRTMPSDHISSLSMNDLVMINSA